MKALLFLAAFLSFAIMKAQDDIELNLDSIKNIKTTRYSSVNEVGVAISIAGKQIEKIPGNTIKLNAGTDKPSVMFRTVHGVLINPNLFIGGGLGIDFTPESSTGGTASAYSVTFPFFGEFREYMLDGPFNLFLSERLGGAVLIDPHLNKINGNGKATGAFGEFMIGGRYVTAGKKFAIHFGVGYRLQHLQRRTYVQDPSLPAQVINNVKEITLKHYIPVTLGVTF